MDNKNNMSEKETRKHIIDKDIKKFWNFNDIRKEVNVTKSDFKNKKIILDNGKYVKGELYIDYLLFNDDGFPIGIIEAKKYSKNESIGRTQSFLYRDEIEKQLGYKPFIFLTNGKKWKIIEQDDYEQDIKNIFSKNSLNRKLELLKKYKGLKGININQNIITRDKSKEMIFRVCESIDFGKRKALIDMATGTGKTRVACGLIDVLIRKNKVKNVLFVVDRDGLRTQALDDLKEYFGDVFVFSKTSSKTGIFVDSIQKFLTNSKDDDKHKSFEKLDSGFFDLIIFDESHRSFYKEGKKFFDYFECLKIGLTATPKGSKYDKNTFELFDCQNDIATTTYSFDEAVSNGTLVNFKGEIIESDVFKEGVKGTKLSEKEKDELRKNELDPNCIDFSGSQYARVYLNIPTIDLMITEFMNNCYKDDLGIPCKTIFFCVNIKHCSTVKERFQLLYPQIMKSVRIIHSKEYKYQDAIKKFKSKEDIRIAISVGVLDTGINVPEICNLVMFCPVHSKIRLWQMIGRGTRNLESCKIKSILPNLEKNDFKIFDLKIGGFSNIENLRKPDKKVKTTPTKIENILIRRCDLLNLTRTNEEKEVFIDKINTYFKKAKPDSYSFRKHRDILLDIKKNKFNIEKHIDDIKEDLYSEFVGIQIFDEINVVDFLNLSEKLFMYYYNDDYDKIKKIEKEIKEIVSCLYDSNMVSSDKKEFLIEILGFNFVDLTFNYIENLIKELLPIMKYYKKPTGDVIILNQFDKIIDKQKFENVVEDTGFIKFLKECPTVKKIQNEQKISGEEIKEIEKYFINSKYENDFKGFETYHKDFLEFLLRILNIKLKLDTDGLVKYEFNNFLVRECENMNSNQLAFLNKLQRVLINKPIKYLDDVKLSDLEENSLQELGLVTFSDNKADFISIFKKINHINWISSIKL